VFVFVKGVGRAMWGRKEFLRLGDALPEDGIARIGFPNQREIVRAYGHWVLVGNRGDLSKVFDSGEGAGEVFARPHSMAHLPAPIPKVHVVVHIGQ